jgi:hypothetical protein
MNECMWEWNGMERVLATFILYVQTHVCLSLYLLYVELSQPENS